MTAIIFIKLLKVKHITLNIYYTLEFLWYLHVILVTFTKVVTNMVPIYYINIYTPRFK